MAPTRKLAELFYELRARTDGLTKDLKTAETQVGKLATFVKANPTAAFLALGTAVAGVALQATRMASEVENSLRRVSNAIPNGTGGLDKLREGIRSVSRDTGIAQAEIARNLGEIAKAGVEGPEQAVQRLKAVQTAVDATGEQFSTVVEGLDQTLDLFGGSSEDAARALGTLFAAAKGRTSLSDLFASLQAASPTINKLKLDLDTAARALVALGEQGLSAKQAATELNRLGDAGDKGADAIKALANSIQPTTDGLADLTKAANDFNNSAEQLQKRSLNELQNVLIDIGRALLPKVKAELIDLLDIIELFTGARAKRIKDLGLTDLGAKFSESVRKNTDVLELQTGSFVRAAKDLQEILNKGQLDLVATTAEGVAAVSAGIQHLQDVGILKAEEAEALVKRLGDLTAKANAAGTDLRGGKSGPTAEELKAQADAAKKAREEIEQLGEKLGDLGTVQQLATGQADLSAKAYADFAAELLKARAKFPQFAEDIDAMSKRLFQLRQAAASFEGAQLAHEIDLLLASFTTTTIDDLELALGELQKRLRDKGASEEQIKQLTDLEQSFIAVRASSEALDAALAEGRRGGITPLKEMVRLLDQLSEAERSLQALESAGPTKDRERKELLEQIAKLKERIKELEDKTAEATKKTTTNTKTLADGLSDALDVAFGLSTALLGANDTLTKMIGAAGQVANGLSSIAKLATEAGGLGKLFGSGAGILSALPALGTIIGGAGAIASLFADNPDERANREATQKNTQALHELQKSLGDLARITASGATTSAVQGAISSIDLKGVNSNVEAFKRFVAAIRAAGLSVEDVTALAKELGFDLSRFTVEGLKAFQQGLRDLDFAAFTDTFAGQLAALEQRFRLFDVSAPQDQFEGLVDLLTNPKTGAPALFGALEGLDVSTAEGAKKAKDVIQKLFQDLLDKNIDPDLLNGLNLDEFRNILDRLFGLIGDEVNASLTDTLSKAFSDIDLDLAISGDKNPITRALKEFQAAAQADARFADLLGFNLSSAEGRQQAEQFLQQLSIGADEDFKRIILELLNAIRDIPDAVGDGVGGEVEVISNAAKGLTETTGNRMADYLATANILERRQIELLEQISGAVRGAPAPPLVQSPAFSASLGNTTTASTSVNLNVQAGAFVVNTPAITDPTVREQVAGDLSQAFIRKVSEGLAREQRNLSRASGLVLA